MYLVIGLLAGVVFFVCTISAYVLGIKHGKSIKHGGVPNLNPIKAHKEKKNQEVLKQEMDKFSEGLQNLLNFGEPFKEDGGIDG